MRRPTEILPRLAAGVVLTALLLAGCGDDGGGDDRGAVTSTSTSATAASPSTTDAGETAGGAVDAGAVEAALLDEETESPLRVDPTAGPEEARCVAGRLVADMSAEELAAIGLPDDFDGLTSILADEDATLRFFAGVFDCLDMVPFLIEAQDELPEARARCIAEQVVDDAGVRLLFLVGTTDGSTPGAPGQYDEEIARLDAYRASCP
jgi:hypothetical protein